MTMILISIELPTTWNPRSKEKKETRKTMKIFELLWKRCFLYTANNGINDFFDEKKEGLSEKKENYFILVRDVQFSKERYVQMKTKTYIHLCEFVFPSY